jgi:hypothetical protein
MAGGEPLRIKGHHGDPFVVDWKGDGVLHILSGSTEGGVQWAENVAGKGKMPELRQFKPLIKPGHTVQYGQPLSESDLTGPTSSTRIWVADVNGDGKLDILVGDSVTLVAPAKGLSLEEFKKKQAEWQKAIEKVSQEMSSQKDQAARTKANQEFQKLYRQRSAFMTEEMTGFVWVYLQK